MNKKRLNLTEEQYRNLYKILKIVIWVIALLSMIGLAINDSVSLTKQYIDSEPVATVKVVDASLAGIKIPNTTVCLQYNAQNVGEMAGILNASLEEMTPQDIWFISDKLAKLDQNTFDSNWWDNAENMTMSTYLKSLSLLGHWSPEEFIDFRLKSANYLCNLFHISLLSLPNWQNSTSINIDVCDLANQDQLPLVMSDRLMCFRLPTYMLNIKENAINRKGYMSFNPYLSTEEKIMFTISPLAGQFLWDNNEDQQKNVFTMILLFPEKPVSYYYPYDPLIDTLNNQFMHAIKYPQDIDYMTETTINVQFEITGKIHRLSDEKECLDVYNKTNCVVTCRESVFARICNCTRYSFRHFTPLANMSICSPQELFECAPLYNQFLQAQNDSQFLVEEIEKCFNACSKCSQLKFSYTVDEIIKQDNSLEVCQDLKKYKLLESNFSCSLLKDNKVKHLAHVLLQLQRYQCPKCDNQTTTRLLDQVFGHVQYVFSLKSFTYPLLQETITLTEEGFISQLGGILGLYLGFSFIACFTIIINIMQLIKKRWQRKTETKRHITLATTTILQIWRMFAERKASREEDIHDNNNHDQDHLGIH